jgi:hypothetical protein
VSEERTISTQALFHWLVGESTVEEVAANLDGTLPSPLMLKRPRMEPLAPGSPGLYSMPLRPVGDHLEAIYEKHVFVLERAPSSEWPLGVYMEQA